ncbi:type I restriction modification DNA specificity domain protein [Bifidobacterium bifidum]|uniref:Type I restriction modification DNA specificity domain protein n=1 Tax=Bifidobacterium bifidum TaxID=1681 RepID=A0A133KSY2_BIFBI|nr:type I restriction modification DNA specificity domain protein [Bifidobacterium bifidum]
MSAINYLPPFANSLIMHVLTNAEKLIPLRDAASLAESRRLAGMRMVTGTTSPSTRYERISVSPASCSIKSEYVIASHAFKPQYKCINYTPAWEQRKLGDVASSFDYGLNAAATEYDGQNKYLRITDIDDETHEFSKSDLTTPLADLAMSADYLLKEGDLLFARTGASVGKTYLYRQFDGMVYFAGFLIRARIGEGADPEFAYQATLTDAYKKYVAITSQRSGQPGVNAQEYADYQLMLPSKTEQQQIGMTLRSLDDLITLHQRKRQWLKWLDEGGEGTHHDIDILVFKFADDMKISVLCGVHACMTKSLGHTGNRYAGKQQQRGMGVP